MHGGTLRSMQIREALNERIEDVCEIEFDYQLKRASLLRAIPLLSLSVLKKLSDGLTLPGLLKLISLRAQVRSKVERGSVVFLETCGINSILLGMALRMHGCRVVSFPHNIEALVRGVNTRMVRDEFSWMRFEVELYRVSSGVYTISEFDCAVLGCFGVSAECFPYFPSSSRLKWLEGIRELRSESSKSTNLLLFSSVNNPPTRIAVADFLNDFLNADGLSDFKLVVAGRGTDQFRSQASSQVEVLGEVSNDVAESLQVDADLSIIPALQTTGFLTKLIENNLMRLPSLVLGDYLQAQSLEDYGIYMNSGFEDLLSLNSPRVPDQKTYKLFQRPILNFNQ